MDEQNKVNWSKAPAWANIALHRKVNPTEICFVGAVIDNADTSFESDGVVFKLTSELWEFEEMRPEPMNSFKTATDFLNECVSVQKQRGEQYDKTGSGERSFAACANAFNAVTGRDLKASDICLILQYLKDVRQYSDPTRLHLDSVLDKVSYASLHAEELSKELK